ncbi:hypothetical protein [Ferdinandcohnia sp. Marseille-Q9671]
MKLKLKLTLILIPLMLLLLYSLTYIPQTLFEMDPTEVSRIEIFDGNSGYEITLTSEEEISHIINNLNEVTFKKGKLSAGYLGYRFNTTIYDVEGYPIEELIINSEDTIRYKGFFHYSTEGTLAYQFIDELVEKNVSKEGNE